jgi:hypothetical protein
MTSLESPCAASNTIFARINTVTHTGGPQLLNDNLLNAQAYRSCLVKIILDNVFVFMNNSTKRIKISG